MGALNEAPPVHSGILQKASSELPLAALQASSATLETPASDPDRLAALEAEVKKMREADEKRKADAAKRPTFQIGGQLQVDYLYFGQDTASRDAVGDIGDMAGFRRARFVARGEAYDVIDYAIGFDFALPGRPSFLDVFVGVHDLPYVGNFRVGHYFEPFSLERLTLTRYNTFMERSLADALAPARNTGMMLFDTIGEEELGTWAVGWFRASSDDFGDDVGDEGEQAATARLTWLPFYDEPTNGRSYLHVGAAYSYRDADEGVVRFASRPEARLFALNEGDVPLFVDTGQVPARGNQLFGTEVAWVRGPFSAQAEYIFAPTDQLNGPDLIFHGGYAYVSYFLTGEHRPYIKKQGTMDRVVPFENFFHVRTGGGAICTGRGAWEVAARLSYIDLNEHNIEGGELTDFTVGLNWYLNPYTRWKIEYIHAHLNRLPVGNSDTHIVGMRFDIDF